MEIRIPGRHAPSVLAFLALQDGTPVHHDRIAQLLWSDQPPPTAYRQISNVLSNLRRHLLGHGFDGLSSRNRFARLEDADTDIRMIDADIESGRKSFAECDYEAALTTLERVVESIPNKPFAELDAEPFTPEATRLLRVRESLRHDVVDCLIERRQLERAVREAREVVDDNPVSGKAARLLIKALHVSGDRSEALHVFEEHRQLIGDELGIDPDADTRGLHTEILRDDEGGNEVDNDVPRELPPRPHVFLGRGDEVRILSEALSGPRDKSSVVAVSGAGGMGKSALALHVAHEESGRFPDGQAYVDLRGHTPGLEPLEAKEAVNLVLRSFGVAVADNESLNGLEARLRTELNRKRAIVFLDNARDVSQVRSLIPGGGMCTVIVTSRRPLVLPEAGRNLHLEPLDDAESGKVLQAYLGEAIVRESPRGIERIISVCGGMPLALIIAAAKCRVGGAKKISAFADRLKNENARLEALAFDDLAVKASVAMSFADVCRRHGEDSEVVRLFLLLGQFPGTSFTVHLAAAILGVDASMALDLLDILEENQLISMVEPDRYRFHDLIRGFAWSQWPSRWDDEVRNAAFERAVKFYAVAMVEAAATLVPVEAEYLRTSEEYPANDISFSFADQEAAGAWYRMELPNAGLLLDYTGDNGSLAMSWAVIGRIAVALDMTHQTSPHWREAIIDRALGRLDRLSPYHRHIARFSKYMALLHRGDAEQCIPLLEEGYEEALGSQLPEWSIVYRTWMSHALRCAGHSGEAYRLAMDSLIDSRKISNIRTEFWALVRGSQAAEELGEHDEACRLAEEVVAKKGELDADNQVYGRNVLGFRYIGAGRFNEALEIFEEVLRNSRSDVMDVSYEVKALWGLGKALAGLGRISQAKARFDESAWAMYRTGNIIDAERQAISAATLPETPRYVAW
ncbi:AfsR/SARP family transcriptional regulator [Haloglycomyces albus]|uniref:AfsR/SARP family transcriptional regulator n=1 Tax=Haloglycomyces albus TaxID=526067 RepID=UPI00146FAE7F|nr:BTAD domain-containing putative transcriptional regulator [Haloglycomyces albus]